MEIRQILLDKNVDCRMRDGVTLYADVYRPNVEGSFPVLLTRLPYNKDSPFYSHRYLDTNRLVQQGYVVIIQDVRGRFSSEGEFYPHRYEAEDGYDTVEWAASLPYSSGDVGMFGLSYYGYTQLLAAVQQPPHLRAIFPTMTLNGHQEKGPFSLASSESLALGSFAPDLIARKYKDEPEVMEEKMQQLAAYENNIEFWYDYAPIRDFPPLKDLGVVDNFFSSLTAKHSDESTIIFNKYHCFKVPAYHVAGWYDSLLEPTIENYYYMSREAEGSKIGQQQKLMIGPWAHGDFSSAIGERDFGKHASEESLDLKEDLTDLHIRWFDQWLKNKDTQMRYEAPVKLFVMGINQWRDEYEWPLHRAVYTPYYLTSSGKANSRFGDGSLSWEKSKTFGSDAYIYDPKNPVPTHGGGTMYKGAISAGPLDQNVVEERNDVLIYTSSPLQESIEVTGPVKVVIWAMTDADDTDFTAKFIDVTPDGQAYNLTDGIVRARYQHFEQTGNNLPGKVLKYEMNLWSTSNVFLPGHQIRVEISSSNFPRYDTNLNTGQTMIESRECKKAYQTIYHNEKYPSHIILPIIPK